MKARTLGPLLMMTLGAAVTLAPTTGRVGAVNVTCQDQNLTRTEFQPECPCEPGVFGFSDPCVVNTVFVTLPSPTTVVPPTTAAAPTTTAAVAPSTTTAAVVAPSTTDLGSAGQGLPATGSTSTSYVVLGGLLLIAGAGLLVLGRGKTDPAAN